jgi:tetratricopeptide (TPR) repeat protein
METTVEIDWAVWGLPLAAMVTGGVMGWFLVNRQVQRDASIAGETRRIDLESTHEDMLEALRLLDLDKDKMPAPEWKAERQALLSRGARALAALDGASPEEVLATTAPAPREEAEAAPAPRGAAAAGGGGPLAGMSPEWRGAFSMLAVLAVLFGLWQWATNQSQDRREGASMTGNQSLGAKAPDPGQDFANSQEFKDGIAAVQAKLAANPNDLEALNEGTHLSLNAGDPKTALDYNDKALAVSATDTDARTYRAILTAMMGMSDKALEQIDAVLKDDPSGTRPIIFKSMLLAHMNRNDEAIQVLEDAVKAYPQSPELMRALQATKQQLAGQPPGGAPPGAGGGEVLAAGTIQLDPASQGALKGGETLFISLSDPARPGPPVAADKKTGPLQFPMPFQLTTAEIRAMPGAGGVPDVMDVKARIDLDGNAMTKEDGAPSAIVTGVHKGQTGLVLTLSLSGAPTQAPAMSGGAPSGGGLLAPMAPPAGGGGGDLLAAGVAKLDPARASAVSPTEIVFVAVKDPAGGPPLAVQRMPAQFPLNFRVTTANVIPMMQGRPMPSSFVVDIRVDEDGNATTRNGEPEAVLQGVAKGSDQLDATLK